MEATVIEKTESWPKVNMKFRRKCRSQRKRSKSEKIHIPFFPNVRMHFNNGTYIDVI